MDMEANNTRGGIQSDNASPNNNRIQPSNQRHNREIDTISEENI